MMFLKNYTIALHLHYPFDSFLSILFDIRINIKLVAENTKYHLHSGFIQLFY